MTSERLSSRIERWSHRFSLAALLVLVALVLVPDGFLWTGPAAAALVGLTLAGAVVLGRRAILSLAEATAKPQAYAAPSHWIRDRLRGREIA